MNRAQAIAHLASRTGSPRTFVGADGPVTVPHVTLNYSDYQKMADFQFTSGDKAKSMVVTLTKDGGKVSTKTYDTSQAASDAYDAIVNAPGDVWYAALYDPNKIVSGEQPRVDDSYFGGLTVDETVTKDEDHTTLIPIAIGATIALGMLIATGKKAHR